MDDYINAMVVILIGINTIWIMGKLIVWALRGSEDERSNDDSGTENSDNKRNRR